MFTCSRRARPGLNELREKRSVIGRAEAEHGGDGSGVANGAQSTSKNATIRTNRRPRSDLGPPPQAKTTPPNTRHPNNPESSEKLNLSINQY